MFSVIPTTAALPTQEEFHAHLASAKATADAVIPYLTLKKRDSSTNLCGIRKVVSCQAFYSALLRSDGTLLLLTNTTASDSVASPASCGARVSVLESGGEAVTDVAAGACHIVYCTATGAVYSCGYDNAYGQLGDGTVWSSSSLPTSAAQRHGGETEAPQLSVPRRIAGFGGADAAGSAGDAWGDADASTSAEGAAACETQRTAAQPLSPPPGAAASSPMRRAPCPCCRRIRQVACGAHHTLLLTQSGRCVYACGRGDHGELGGARAVLLQPSFRSVPLLFGLPLRQVAAADAHSFALLENGLLYAFGDNTCGQLGLGHTRRVTQPTFVPLCGQEREEKAEAGAAGPPHTSEAAPAAARSLLPDAKAYASLRAPYGSAEGAYYPLRVPRLLAERRDTSGAADVEQGVVNPSSTGSAATSATVDDAQVRWVHCCGSWTLLKTNRPDVWLSCGAFLTRGLACNAEQASPAEAAAATQMCRIDGCGVLGRPLPGGNKVEAYRFAPVLWPSLLTAGDRPSRAAQATSTTDNPRSCPDLGRGSEAEERNTACCSTTATSEDITVRQGTFSNPLRRASDTEPSLCHTKKLIRAEENTEGIRVCLYATSLMVLLGDEEAEGRADATGVQTGLVVSRLLLQNGTPYAAAVEVPVKADAATCRMVTERTADAPGHTPCGASVLKLSSTYGQFLPLRSYALLL